MRSGAAINAFQAPRQASTISLEVSRSRLESLFLASALARFGRGLSLWNFRSRKMHPKPSPLAERVWGEGA